MNGNGLRTLSIATLAALTGAFALVFFYAPTDADQGFIQKIFYLHVPLAIVALVGFVVAGVYGIKHLRTGDSVYDMRSYVAIHLSVIFGSAVLVTGSIWARGSWGKWWVWDEPTLVSFLIVFLLYATYYPFRYAIEDRDRQARYASVFAICAGAFVPLNFLAVRLAESLVHPRVLSATGGSMRGDGAAVADPGQGGTDREEHEVPAAPPPSGARGLTNKQMPALPIEIAEDYVAGAYLAFLALILVYVAIMAARLHRVEREVRELSLLASRRDGSQLPVTGSQGPEETAPSGRGIAPGGS
jgi:heme exporter protein C